MELLWVKQRADIEATALWPPLCGLKDSGTQLRVMSYIHHWLKRKHWNWVISPCYLTWYHMLEFLKNFSTLCNIFIRSSPLWSLKLLIMNCLCVFFLIFPYLFVIFGCAAFCCYTWAFSSCLEQALLWSCSVQASHCRGFSCCKERALEPRLSSFNTRTYLHSNMWNLPRRGIERVSPALTAESQPLITGKCYKELFWLGVCLSIWYSVVDLTRGEELRGRMRLKRRGKQAKLRHLWRLRMLRKSVRVWILKHVSLTLEMSGWESDFFVYLFSSLVPFPFLKRNSGYLFLLGYVFSWTLSKQSKFSFVRVVTVHAELFFVPGDQVTKTSNFQYVSFWGCLD